MQNRYAGDVGDFGKFSLLRALFADGSHKLGVIWYLFPDESHTKDGRHISYLENGDYQKCDPYVHAALARITDNERSVGALERSGILPPSTIYYPDVLNFHIQHPSQAQSDKEMRTTLRENWVRRAMESTPGCDVLFLDPDNGLEVPSCSKINQLKAGKYAYLSEVKLFCESSKVCVIYHHLNRHKNHGTHAEQTRNRAQQLKDTVDISYNVLAVRFFPFSPRAYFILSDQGEFDALKEKVLWYLESPCGRYWDSYHELS